MHSFLSCFLALLFLRLSSATQLVNFQVTQPPIVPQNVKKCTIKVLERDFAFSYGLAEVVQLQPPTDCGPSGTWSAITLNFTVTSNGTQYDRLGIFTFQNVEIWRTSTPEPVKGDGIIWTYIKDVTRYLPLFKKPGTFILQLDNLIQEGLDGVYSTVLYATFYASTPSHPPAQTADVLLPISNMKNDTGNDVSVPPGFSLNLTLPRNSVQVIAELYASGNAQEEFWYTNTPNKFLPNLPADNYLGQGPFREVRLLIDGQLAGAVYPYVTFFTGAYVPAFWRPINSYGAQDLPTYFLDVTPFVPLLSDGKPHNFSIDVASAEDDKGILQNWYLSGVLHVYTDSSSKPTTGKMTRYAADPYSKSSTTGTVHANSVDSIVSAKRVVHVESTIVSGSGKKNHVVFSQELLYKNVQNYRNNGLTENMTQTASGSILSTHNGVPVLVDQFFYPVTVNFTAFDSTFKNWSTVIDSSYRRELLPLPNVMKTKIDNRQQTTGYYFIQSSGNYGNGTNDSNFHYSDDHGNTYSRDVGAEYLNYTNVRITHDKESGSLAKSVVADDSQKVMSMDIPESLIPVRLPNGRKYPQAP
ncbi:peptide N-acetyl-beta-D-glucosaminyl asparaginase amidase A-domain-containing protein [Crepidotus variabilis]|uniref:Peptide N-acetyl-beta-D-glucosaminyl asparaginase amidase A-domain-containing protein n=1 Tax=Crepidotus variabilis TaxID=179855 RepID=A0A9P6JUZ2_9AGAR|nr:peptide N-acetyl-beta-D-glucosaminyl asparaginase amidase A-domain-containing protein [Crepidotus variabilis]